MHDRAPVRKKVQSMRASTKNRIAGNYHETRGAVRAAIGSTVNSNRMAFNGNVERAGGIVQTTFGKVQKVFGW